MRVIDFIYNSTPYSLCITATVRNALAIFQKSQLSCLMVTDCNGKAIGSLSLLDLLPVLQEENELDGPISPWINKNAAIFEDNAHVDSLPPLEQKIVGVVKDNQLIGIIKDYDVVQHVFKQFQKMYDLLQLVVDSAYNGIVAINNKGIIIAYNSAAERILKVKKEDALGQHIEVVDSSKGLLEVIHSGQPQTGHKHVINNDNIVTNRTPLIKDGAVIGAVAIFQDISEVEAISQELDSVKRLVNELNAIIETSYDGIFITDNLGKIIRVNNSWERISGLSREEVVGRTVKEMVDMGVYSKSSAQMVLDTGKTSTAILEMKLGKNKGQKIMATGTPVFDEEGIMSKVVVNVRDMKKLVNLKAQLEHSQQLTERYSSEIREIRRQQQKFPDIISHSKEMQQVMDMVSRVAEVDSTVLITGESGVGKEVVAGYLHKLSSRKKGPMIKINCGAIPVTLLESELFGYEPGAFTGANKRGKIGLFELAHEGTLFLDEIAEMPIEVQVKLLRSIQHKEIYRIGGEQPIKIDVRIVTATNQDLKQMTGQGKFREDLFYRLNVINIHIPPLRERKDDIPPLIFNFLDKYNKKHQRRVTMASPMVNKLTGYYWPGNIRELENLIERLVVLVEGNEVLMADLPEVSGNNKSMEPQISVHGIIPLKIAVGLVEKIILSEAKQRYVTTRKMAEVLGVDQSTVVRKVKALNL